MSAILSIIEYGFGALMLATYALVLPTAFFALLALALRGREAIAAAQRAGEEVRINLWLHFLDALFVLPLMALLVGGITALLRQTDLVLLEVTFWAALGPLSGPLPGRVSRGFHWLLAASS